MLAYAALLALAPRMTAGEPLPSREEMERRLFAVADTVQGRVTRLDGAALSRSERVFRDIWELEAQVNNGGFNQYFFNSSGRNAPDAPAALRVIGADKMAAIVELALAVPGPGIEWPDDDKRQSAVMAMGAAAEARLEALDDQFFAYPDDLTVRLYALVAAHRADFASPRRF